jgi:hypothetical protein
MHRVQGMNRSAAKRPPFLGVGDRRTRKRSVGTRILRDSTCARQAPPRPGELDLRAKDALPPRRPVPTNLRGEEVGPDPSEMSSRIAMGGLNFAAGGPLCPNGSHG